MLCSTRCGRPFRCVARSASGERVLGAAAEQVGRHAVEQRLQGLHDLCHVVAVLVVGVGVASRVPRDLLDGEVAVLAEGEVTAVVGRGEAVRHQQREVAVRDEVELVDDVGPEQAHRVGERGEVEAGHQLLGDRRAAHQVTPLEDEGAQTRLRQVRTVHQPVVATADHDGVVGPRGGHAGAPAEVVVDADAEAVLRAGLNSGGRATSHATVW